MTAAIAALVILTFLALGLSNGHTTLHLKMPDLEFTMTTSKK